MLKGSYGVLRIWCGSLRMFLDGKGEQIEGSYQKIITLEQIFLKEFQFVAAAPRKY